MDETLREEEMLISISSADKIGVGSKSLTKPNSPERSIISLNKNRPMTAANSPGRLNTGVMSG